MPTILRSEPDRRTLERAIRCYIATPFSAYDPHSPNDDDGCPNFFGPYQDRDSPLYLHSKWVIPRREPGGGPTPEAPQSFVTAFVYLTESLGTTWTGLEPDADTVPDDEQNMMYRVYQNKRCIVSVQFYRKYALDRAEAFEVWAAGPLGRLEAQGHGLGFKRVTTVRTITARLKEKWEERAIVDLHLEYTAQSSPQNMGRIDVATVELRGNFGYGRSTGDDLNPVHDFADLWARWDQLQAVAAPPPSNATR